MRSIAITGLVLLISTSNLLAVPAPIEPPEPTADQLKAAKEAFKKLGADYYTGNDERTGRTIHGFRMPEKTTDADLKELPDLPFRFILILRKCAKVTDSGLTELKNRKNLAGLFLGETKVTDGGLKELKEFKNLTVLGFSGAKVTDAWLKKLTDLKNLTELVLIETKVTDTGMKELKDLTNLAYLCLEGANVSDMGFQELKGLKNLYRLDVGGTKITDAGINELKEALPKCEIRK